MARQLHELTDAEITNLSPAELNAMLVADGGNNETENGNNDDDANNDQVEELNPVLNSEDDKVEAPKVNADANDKEDENGDKGEKVASANGAEAGKGVDATANDGTKIDATAKADGDKAAKTGAAADGSAVTPPVVVDYEAEHKALLAPFKANGRDIQVADVGEARQLMQMGANYNKKMQAMKPHLATLRMLENAKIGDAELSYLIDLHRKDPTAINKLVKDSGIDPLDLTAEKAADYKPTNHKPSDAEVELEAVLTDLDGSEGLPKTIDIVTKQWDVASKGVVAQHPGLLRLINSHVEAGIYELIATEVDRRKTFGQLSGLSDFEAYRQVGDEMNASNKFAHLEGSSQQSQQAAAAPVIKAPDPKKADEDKRKEQKRGAAPAKVVVTNTKVDPDFNPLSMSDEDFAKLNFKP